MWDQQTCSYKHVAMMVWLVRPPIRVPILPLEVRKHIIDLLAEDLYKVTEVGATFHALRMCSLTCRSLLKAARRHLFKRVVLSQPRHLASLASSHSDVFPHVVGLTAHDIFFGFVRSFGPPIPWFKTPQPPKSPSRKFSRQIKFN